MFLRVSCETRSGLSESGASVQPDCFGCFCFVMQHPKDIYGRGLKFFGRGVQAGARQGGGTSYVVAEVLVPFVRGAAR